MTRFAHTVVFPVSFLPHSQLAFQCHVEDFEDSAYLGHLVEHEVRSKLEAGMSIKGYLYHSDHSVPPQVSWETYQFIVELVNRYGNY